LVKDVLKQLNDTKPSTEVWHLCSQEEVGGSKHLWCYFALTKICAFFSYKHIIINSSGLALNEGRKGEMLREKHQKLSTQHSLAQSCPHTGISISVLRASHPFTHIPRSASSANHRSALWPAVALILPTANDLIPSVDPAHFCCLCCVCL